MELNKHAMRLRRVNRAGLREIFNMGHFIDLDKSMAETYIREAVGSNETFRQTAYGSLSALGALGVTGAITTAIATNYGDQFSSAQTDIIQPILGGLAACATIGITSLALKARTIARSYEQARIEMCKNRATKELRDIGINR